MIRGLFFLLAGVFAVYLAGMNPAPKGLLLAVAAVLGGISILYFYSASREK